MNRGGIAQTHLHSTQLLLSIKVRLFPPKRVDVKIFSAQCFVLISAGDYFPLFFSIPFVPEKNQSGYPKQ